MSALEKEVAAIALEGSADQRTKMVLARSLQRHGEVLPGETLQSLWHLTLKELRGRTEHLFHVPPAPPVGLATPAPLASRGRGRGRGPGRGPVAALPARPADPASFLQARVELEVEAVVWGPLP